MGRHRFGQPKVQPWQVSYPVSKPSQNLSVKHLQQIPALLIAVSAGNVNDKKHMKCRLLCSSFRCTWMRVERLAGLLTKWPYVIICIYPYGYVAKMTSKIPNCCVKFHNHAKNVQTICNHHFTFETNYVHYSTVQYKQGIRQKYSKKVFSYMLSNASVSMLDLPSCEINNVFQQ
jgi:hypothetical protein